MSPGRHVGFETIPPSESGFIVGPVFRTRMPQWEMIVGKNPVLEAIRAERSIGEILVADGSQAGAKEILDAARSEGIPIKVVPKQKLEQEAKGANHQGVLAFVKARAYATPEELFEEAASRGEEALIVAIDGIEDPQNLGAIIRAAHAAGAHGVILGTRATAPLTPTAVKASSGASEHTKVSRVPSLPNALLDIQRKQRAWIVGTDPSEGQVFYESKLTGPLVLVVGSEERGLSHLVRDRCDAFVRIPMFGKVDSLNAATATAVVLFERVRQRAQSAPPAAKR
jgi:23S rRNA (guanosine2251-2'-O)-methyltransferase